MGNRSFQKSFPFFTGQSGLPVIRSPGYSKVLKKIDPALAFHHRKLRISDDNHCRGPAGAIPCGHQLLKNDQGVARTKAPLRPGAS
jgi:hypothetical protein